MSYRILIISLFLQILFCGCENSAGLDDDAIKLQNGKESKIEYVSLDNISFNIKELTFDGLQNIPYLDWGIDFKLLSGTAFFDTSNNELKLSLNNYSFEQDLFVFAQRPDSIYSIKFSIIDIPIDVSNPDIENGIELKVSNLDYQIELLIHDSNGNDFQLMNDDLNMSIAYQIKDKSDLIKLYIKAEVINSTLFTSGIQLQSNVFFKY